MKDQLLEALLYLIVMYFLIGNLVANLATKWENSFRRYTKTYVLAALFWPVVLFMRLLR